MNTQPTTITEQVTLTNQLQSNGYRVNRFFAHMQTFEIVPPGGLSHFLSIAEVLALLDMPAERHPVDLEEYRRCRPWYEYYNFSYGGSDEQ